MGYVDPLLSQPPLPKCGQISHEREGSLPHVGQHVHRKSTTWWENALQRFPDPSCRGYQQPEKIKVTEGLNLKNLEL